MPKSAFGRAPRRIGLRDRRQSLGRSHHYLDVSCEEILNKNPQTPAVGNGMMNRENQHVLVGRATQISHAVERPLHEVEWRAENLRGQFFDRFWSRIVWRQLRESRN